MAISVEYFSAAGTALANGVFFPINTLFPLTAEDLEASDTDKESKVVRNIISKLYEQISNIGPLFKPLGLGLTLVAPVVSGSNLFNQTYLMSETRMGNLATSTLEPIPLQTIGENNGRGSFPIANLHPYITKVQAGGAIPGAGILISSNTLAIYGAPNHAALNVTADCRNWWAALLNHICNDVTKRSTTTPSAIITATKGATTILTPPPSFTDVNNPTTGVTASELPLRFFVTSTYSITIQVRFDSANASINNVSS